MKDEKTIMTMTKKEIETAMFDWFPFLREPMPYQPRLKTKDEKEQDRAWALWRADMQDAVEHHRQFHTTRYE